jgi:RNA-directed DNA polymerase
MLCRKTCAKWILEGDIKGCFDNISHRWLIDNVPTDKRILGRWLRSGFIYKKKLFSTEAGTPQCGIISPVIANMALDGLRRDTEKEVQRARSTIPDMQTILL